MSVTINGHNYDHGSLVNSSFTNNHFHTNPDFYLDYGYTLAGGSISYAFKRRSNRIYSETHFQYYMAIIPAFTKVSNINHDGTLYTSDNKTIEDWLEENTSSDSPSKFKLQGSSDYDVYDNDYIWSGSVTIPSWAKEFHIVVICEGCGTEHFDILKLSNGSSARDIISGTVSARCTGYPGAGRSFDAADIGYMCDVYTDLYTEGYDATGTNNVFWYFHPGRSKSYKLKFKTNLGSDWSYISGGKIEGMSVLLSSSDTNVATVSSDGTITAVGKGTTIISATISGLTSHNLSLQIKDGFLAYSLSNSNNISYSGKGLAAGIAYIGDTGTASITHVTNKGDLPSNAGDTISLAKHSDYSSTSGLSFNTNNSNTSPNFKYTGDSGITPVFVSTYSISTNEYNPSGSGRTAVTYSRRLSTNFSVAIVNKPEISITSNPTKIAKYNANNTAPYEVNKIHNNSYISNVFTLYYKINTEAYKRPSNGTTSDPALVSGENKATGTLTYKPSDSGISHSNTGYTLYLKLHDVISYGGFSVSSWEPTDSISDLLTYSIPENMFVMFGTDGTMNGTSVTINTNQTHSITGIASESGLLGVGGIAWLAEEIANGYDTAAYSGSYLSKYNEYRRCFIDINRRLCLLFMQQNSHDGSVYKCKWLPANYSSTASSCYEKAEYKVQIIRELSASSTQVLSTFTIIPETDINNTTKQCTITLDKLADGTYEDNININNNTISDHTLHIKFYINIKDKNDNIIYDGSASSGSTAYPSSFNCVYDTEEANAQKLYVRLAPRRAVSSITKAGVYPYTDRQDNPIPFPIVFTHNAEYGTTNPIDIPIFSGSTVVGYEDLGITSGYRILLYTDYYQYTRKDGTNEGAYEPNTVVTDTTKSLSYIMDIDHNYMYPIRWYNIEIAPYYDYTPTLSNTTYRKIGPSYELLEFVYRFSVLRAPTVIYPHSGNPLFGKNGIRWAIVLPVDPDYQYLSSADKNNYEYADLNLQIDNYDANNSNKETCNAWYSNPSGIGANHHSRIEYHSSLKDYNAYHVFKEEYYGYPYPYVNGKPIQIKKIQVKKKLPASILAVVGTYQYLERDLWSIDSASITHRDTLSNWQVSNDGAERFTQYLNVTYYSYMNMVPSTLSIDMSFEEYIKAEDISLLQNLARYAYMMYRDESIAQYNDTNILMESDPSYFRNHIIYMSTYVSIYNALVTLTDNFNSICEDVCENTNDLDTVPMIETYIMFDEFQNLPIENNFKCIIDRSTEYDESRAENSNYASLTDGFNYANYLYNMLFKKIWEVM